MLKSNWLSQIGIAAFALLLVGTWLRHLAAVRVHAGVHYTYSELILFSVSIGACIFLSSRRWGRAANILIDGWAVATLLAAVLHMTFNWLQLSPAPGLPWLVVAAAIVVPGLLVGFTIQGPAFLAMFGAAALISRRLPIARFGLFALAGSLAGIAAYFIIGGIHYIALTWWPYRAVDAAIGAIAGVTFWSLTRPTEMLRPVSA